MECLRGKYKIVCVWFLDILWFLLVVWLFLLCFLLLVWFFLLGFLLMVWLFLLCFLLVVCLFVLVGFCKVILIFIVGCFFRFLLVLSVCSCYDYGVNFLNFIVRSFNYFCWDEDVISIFCFFVIFWFMCF